VQIRHQRAQLQDLGPSGNSFTGITPEPASKTDQVLVKEPCAKPSEAQRLGDEFMVRVNERNNQPHLFASDDETCGRLQEVQD